MKGEEEGTTGIGEGIAIPFAASDPLCIIPPSIVGSAAGAVGSVVAMPGIVLLKKTLAAK